MHSECNRDRASPTPEGCSQAIELPKQLETVRRAADFPPERHRWNTNEEVAALLIAFDHHAVWETKDVRLRPPSGTMLLYSRKKVRYRKDGFCWKKRKDGKTTREDHMKLKVQGIECIYGCYVHSAILPTFHRRCYWLLQNPDIVLVHYLNVPLTNDNKLCCLPPISLQLDCRDWSRKDLVSQLRPMFASVKHFDVANNVEEMVEKAIESVVGHLLNRSDSGCPSNTCPKGGTSTANQGIVMFQATTVGPTPLVSTPVQSHILQFVYGQQPPQQGQQQQQQQQQGQQLQQQPDARLSRMSSLSTIDQNVCDNAPTSGSSTAIHQMAPPHNNPLILNLSQLPGGSNSLLILSSQSLAEQVSILNSTDTMSMLNSVESNSVASFNNSTANDNITSSGSQGPCYDVAEYLNCHDLSIEFDLLEEGLKKEAGCERCDGMRIVQEHSNTTVAPLGHLSMPETVRVTVSESVFEGSIHEMRNNHFHSCSKRLRKAIPEYSKCIASDIDNHISSTVRCCNPVELRSEELIMDELEDILHIVNESFDDSAELNGSFDNSELVDDQIAMADAYGHCTHDRATMSTLLSSSNQFSDMNRSKEEPESGADHQLSGKKNSSEVNNGNDNYDEITDFCPEWSYTEGGTKVLVTGPWEHPTSSYSVLFDNISAPTAVVQRGVLRCYAPAHGPAVVCLQVACNGQIISTPKFFEYKSHEELVVAKHKEWFDVEDGELRDSLVKRLVQIGEKLDFKEELSSHKLNADASEQDLINLVKDCSLRIWMTDSLLPTNLKNSLSLLHLAAGLGFHRLIVSLVQWRTDSHSLVLDYEVDSLCTDSDGNTPLMWACAKGQADAAIFLYHWNPGVLNIPNISGCYPLSLLRQRGYLSIADHLEHLKTSTSENYNSNSLQKPDEENQPDIDWIQNSLKTESWMKNETLTRSVVGESTNNTAAEDDWNSSNGETIRWPTDDDVNLPFQRSAKGLRAPTIFGSSNIFTSAMKRTRLMKRTSVDILPDYPQFRSDPSKFSKSDSVNNSQGSGGNTSEDQHAMPVVTSAVLRTSNSDPHLNSHMRSCSSSSGDPMISMIDRDLNSPILFLHSSISIDEDDNGLGLEQESVAMEMGSTERLVDADVLSQEDSEMLQTASVEAAEDSTSLIHSNQMMTLASQIIAAMPERIKVSPNQSKQLLMDEINARRDRSSSYGSFSSCSSSTPPVCQAEDSGISTPLEGMSSFLDYRYVDIGTPASTLSPTSTCMQSPYRFDIDSPPPTTAEFTEYFNAPATFMEKDFSQLTLSDEEQRRLYEAAKIIQSFFRKYKDKKDHQTRQQQKEIEAAILIQSYYRRYKQFMYYKRMTQAAVLIQSQFRSYYAQKCFRRSREAATIIQNRYRAYKEHERFKKSRNAAVIIQQRFRKHYQRTLASKQAALANTVHKMMADSDLKGGIAEDSNVVTDKSRNFTETRPDDTADVKKVGDKEPDKSVECKNESDMEARNDIDESQLDISEGRS